MKLNVKDHVILALLVTSGWFVFYIIGLPSDYFQKCSFTEQIIISLIAFFAAAPFAAFVTIILLNKNYVSTGVWLAFYGSCIPLLLDFMTCGVIQGKGMHFLISHWYLTIGYIYVWIIGPLMGITLQRFKIQLCQKN